MPDSNAEISTDQEPTAVIYRDSNGTPLPGSTTQELNPPPPHLTHPQALPAVIIHNTDVSAHPSQLPIVKAPE